MVVAIIGSLRYRTYLRTTFLMEATNLVIYMSIIDRLCHTLIGRPGGSKFSLVKPCLIMCCSALNHAYSMIQHKRSSTNVCVCTLTFVRAVINK